MANPRGDVDPSPVFVDQTGRRGRRLRGLGWVIGVLCVGFAVAMISGLLGTESQAPAFAVPAAADTTPPSQYVNAPLPSPPGGAGQAARLTAAGPATTAPHSPAVAGTGKTGTERRTGKAARMGTAAAAGNRTGAVLPPHTP